MWWFRFFTKNSMFLHSVDCMHLSHTLSRVSSHLSYTHFTKTHPTSSSTHTRTFVHVIHTLLGMLSSTLPDTHTFVITNSTQVTLFLFFVSPMRVVYQGPPDTHTIYRSHCPWLAPGTHTCSPSCFIPVACQFSFMLGIHSFSSFLIGQ